MKNVHYYSTLVIKETAMSKSEFLLQYSKYLVINQIDNEYFQYGLLYLNKTEYDDSCCL